MQQQQQQDRHGSKDRHHNLVEPIGPSRRPSLGRRTSSWHRWMGIAIASGEEFEEKHKGADTEKSICPTAEACERSRQGWRARECQRARGPQVGICDDTTKDATSQTRQKKRFATDQKGQEKPFQPRAQGLDYRQGPGVGLCAKPGKAQGDLERGEAAWIFA